MPKKPIKPTLRDGTYYLVRKVPVRFAAVEARKQVWISLKTDSETEAKRRTDASWERMLSSWEARLAGDTDDAEAQYEAARALAQALGYRPLPVDRVAALPPRDILERLDAAVSNLGVVKEPDASAVLGLVPTPQITLTRALEIYWRAAKDRNLGKSDDQIRRWQNPKKKAVANFITLVGDLPLDEVSPDDVLDFREWWIDRIEKEGLTPNSANKDLIHLNTIFRTVSQAKRLNLRSPFSGMSISEGDKKKRPAFSTSWISDHILAEGALDRLNPEARALVHTMINTGMRPSEVVSLREDQIKLAHVVPHVSIEPIGRKLKSQYARRKIPLVGVSLDAMRAFPEGLQRYDDKGSISNLVNKYFTNNALRETPEHSLYSIRHNFQDRMLGAGIDDRIRRNLFGHRLTEEDYGSGATLEHMRELLQRIAL